MLTKMNLPQHTQELTFDEQLQRQVDWYNEREGKLVGYDCRLCKNKGYIAELRNREEVLIECSCVEHRKHLRQLRQSGLEQSIENYTFKSFIAKSDWQKKMKKMCRDYFDSAKIEWLFLGGQSGSGKTHLCTAICGKYLKEGISVIYMMWREDSTTLKQSIANNPQYYEDRMKRYKNVPVLYIDDLFKSGKNKDGALAISPADINLAFEILNYRAFRGLKTIISSELTIDEIRKIDEAIAGRIYENSISKNYGISIAYDNKKNFRFGGTNG